MFFDKFLKASKEHFNTKKKNLSTLKHKDIKDSLSEKLADILKSIGEPDDLIKHQVEDEVKTYAVVMYFETLLDSNLLAQHVISPLNNFVQNITGTLSADQLKFIISATKLIEINDIHHAVDRLLTGWTGRLHLC